MSTISGTITGVQLVSGNPNNVGAYKVYLLTVAFGAYSGGSDSGDIQDVAATIKAHVRNGKTMAMVAGAIPVRAHPGLDTNGQAVYIGTCTISSDSLTFNLTDAAQSELSSATACQGCGLLVPILES